MMISPGSSARCLNVPYMSQLDNDSDYNSGPWNECSFESMAMALASKGVVGNGNGQLGDQIEKRFESLGYTRGAPLDMQRFINEEYASMGIVDDFSFNRSLQEIIDCLDGGNPVILHTDLTASGHVITVVGYNTKQYRGRGALCVNDPNGEWFADGYQTHLTGEKVPYSFALCDRLMGPDGNYWAHFIKR